MPVGTARMAHLALPNSELKVGVRFEEGYPGAAVLFPGPGARDVGELAAPPQTLVVIDGTWPQARKVLKENPWLQGLPRVGFMPARPGNYRIRREPAANCVSTVEAVAEVLGRLEGTPERFQAMLAAFERMVDWQLEHIAARTGPPRRKLNKPPPPPPLPRDVLASPERLVVFYGEANAYPLDSVPHFEPELVQWVAERPATGERFEALLAPRAPLAPRICGHLEVPEAALLGGETVESARARWTAFLGEGDRVGGWGHFAQSLAAAEALPLPGFFDLRYSLSRALRARPGDLERGAERVGATPAPPWGRGRAGRRIAALSAVANALFDRARAG